MEPTEVQLDPETEPLPGVADAIETVELPDAQLRAIVEAVIYVTDEPLSADQIATALQQPAARIGEVLAELTAEYNQAGHGLTIREVAGGYKMSTKPEHHEAIRAFVKNLKPPLKLSLAALETLALIAYKQPITAPEVMEVRGVQGAGVIKTLIDRKLIATAGRKTVLGKPILYKTTKEFLVQFGLKDLSELPTLKEFEELGRLSMGDEEMPAETGPEHASASSESGAASSENASQSSKTASASSENAAASSENESADAHSRVHEADEAEQQSGHEAEAPAKPPAGAATPADEPAGDAAQPWSVAE
jgi:segregation and condensation protein B